jgi:hypothetical protein
MESRLHLNGGFQPNAPRVRADSQLVSYLFAASNTLPLAPDPILYWVCHQRLENSAMGTFRNKKGGRNQPARRGLRRAEPLMKPASEKSRQHEWINSVIAVAAFVAAGCSALFAYQANKLHDEEITVSIRPNSTCGIQSGIYGDDTIRTRVPLYYMKLCWDVLISNNSEDKAVITDLTIMDNDKDKDELVRDMDRLGLWPPGEFKTIEGGKLENLMSLAGGDASVVVAYLPEHVSKVNFEAAHKTFLNSSSTGPMTTQEILTRLGSYYFLNNLETAEMSTERPYEICKYLQDADLKK